MTFNTSLLNDLKWPEMSVSQIITFHITARWLSNHRSYMYHPVHSLIRKQHSENYEAEVSLKRQKIRIFKILPHCYKLALAHFQSSQVFRMLDTLQEDEAALTWTQSQSYQSHPHSWNFSEFLHFQPQHSSWRDRLKEERTANKWKDVANSL